MQRFLPIAAVFGAVIAAMTLASCNKYGGTQEITETRTLVTPKEAPKGDVSSAERFGMTGSGMPMAAAQPGFTWTTPEGWEELPSKQFRPINLRPAGDPAAECYVSQLGGTGGGLTENINRWRNQMQLEPIDDAAVAALPKKPLLDGEASYIDLDGTYTGMGTGEGSPDFKMVGLMLTTGGSAVFVKMTGPKALVEQELPKFDAFCASLKAGSPDPHGGMMAGGATDAPGSDLPEGHPPINPQMQTAGAASGTDLQWTAPEGWIQGGPRAMREVTFTLANDSGTECYISKLSNLGGGLEANLNRWAGQMGLDPLSADAIAALPTITVLGSDCPVVELRGNYTDMSGGAHPDSLMLGTIAVVGTDAYFIKMVGPAADMDAQKANFTAFCESLKL